MKPPRDYGRQPLTDDEMLGRLLACEVYKRAMTPAEQALHERIERTGTWDRATHTHSYTIPPGTDPKMLRAVMKLLDASCDPAAKIVIGREMPRDPWLVEKMDKKILADVISDMGLGRDPKMEKFLKPEMPPVDIAPHPDKLRDDPRGRAEWFRLRHGISGKDKKGPKP